MSNKTKDLILKTILVLDMVLLVMLFPVSVIMSYFISDERLLDSIVYTILFSFVGVGVLFVVLLPIFGGLTQKEVKAEKFSLPYNDYYELTEALSKSLGERQYEEQKSTVIGADVDMTLYLKKPKWGELDVFVIIGIHELTNEILEKANDNITQILSAYYRGKKIMDIVNVISVFCVARITPTFQKLVNSNLQQGLKNGRLNVGVSFGGKKIYIAQQEDGFAIVRYKRLRKTFCDIIGISGK